MNSQSKEPQKNPNCVGYYFSPSLNPQVNLATEEFFFRNLEQLGISFLIFLYVDQPSLILGRSQNAYQELLWLQAEAERIPILRRISGGGAVYHDTGNLNFSFIVQAKKYAYLGHYEPLLQPILHFLKELRLDAYIHSPSDLYVDQYKVSGNAQAAGQSVILQHGTLLFQTDLTRLNSLLTPHQTNITSRAVLSRPAQVANIQDRLVAQGNTMTFSDFKERLQTYVIAWLRELLRKDLEQFGNTAQIQREPRDFTSLVDHRESQDAMQRLISEKYARFSWNLARQANFTLAQPDFTLRVEQAIIQEVHHAAYPELDTIWQACPLKSETLFSRLVEAGYVPEQAKRILCDLFA